MKKEKIVDFRPIQLKKLSLEVEKIMEKKEKDDRKIFKKIKKIFKF